jgi:hypothetical protein
MNSRDCRVMADRRFQRVHGARTVDEPRAYLRLAHVWLEAASVEDHAPPTLPPAPRLQIIRMRKLADHTPQLR